MDMSPTYVGYKFRLLALANCPTNSNLSVTTNADNTSIFNCLINKMFCTSLLLWQGQN